MVAEARAISAETGLDELISFEVGDMRTLEGLPDEGFDVVLANGVLMYALTPDDLDASLRAVRRVLRPGGHLVAYHRSRWRAAHPEHGGRPSQLLPRRLQPGYGDPGWKRWIAPPELAWRLRRAGFDGVRMVGFRGSARHTRWPLRLFGESYGIAGTRR